MPWSLHDLLDDLRSFLLPSVSRPSPTASDVATVSSRHLRWREFAGRTRNEDIGSMHLSELVEILDIYMYIYIYIQQINCYHRYKTHDFLLKLVGIAVPLAIFFPYPIVFRKPTCECQNDRWQTSRVEIEVGQSSLPSTKWCCDVGGDWITLNLLLSHTWRVGEGVRKHSSYEGYERYQYFQILTRLEGVENHSFSDDLLLKWSSNNILKTVFHNCKYKLKQRNCSRITILDTLKNLCCTSPVRIPFQWCQGGGKTKDIRWKCQRAHAM